MSDAVLTVENVCHGYASGGFELRVTRLALHPGEIAGLIGPNGAGKSTLLRIAAGVLRPRSGQVMLGGNLLARMERREVAKRLGYLPQEIAAQFDFRVEELVGLGRFPHVSGFAALSRKDREIVDRSIRQTELENLRERPLSQLSGGERKRAFLASVLAQEPEILLLDEPTVALDIHHQVRFFRLLRELARKGLAVAVVTHEVNLAALFADRIVLMRNGTYLAEGTPRQVLTEDAIRNLYGTDILLHRHPQSGLPIVLPTQVEPEEAR